MQRTAAKVIPDYSVVSAKEVRLLVSSSLYQVVARLVVLYRNIAAKIREEPPAPGGDY